MIVFGWNSFTLARIKPSSVDLPAEMDAENTFVRRQKYAHLFWIPFFPIGQDWIIKKKGDSNAYKPNDNIIQYLDLLPMKYKTPWYSYALPLLAIVAGIVFYAHGEIQSYQWKKENEENIRQKNEELQSLLAKGAPDAYFTLRTEAYKDTYLKVLSSDATTLTCVANRNEMYKQYDTRMLEAFVSDSTHAKGFDTIRVLKTDLQQLYKDKDVYPFAGKKLRSDYEPMNLVEFQVIDYPVFEFKGANYMEGNYLSAFVNIGADAYNFRFKSSELNDNNLSIDAATSMPKVLASSGAIIFTGTYKGAEPILSGTVFYENKNHTKDSCNLLINGVSAYLRK